MGLLMDLWPLAIFWDDNDSGGSGGGGGSGGSGNGDGGAGSGGDGDGGTGGGESGSGEDPYEGWTEAQFKAELADRNNLIGTLRKENKDRRLHAQKVEKELTDRQKQDMTDLEKTQTRVGELETENQELSSRYEVMLLRSAIEREAIKQGFKRPEFAYKLVDLQDVTISQEDEVIGVSAALKKLAKDAPEMLGKTEKPDLEGGKGGAGDGTLSELDETELRSSFGLKPMTQSSKK